MQGQPERKRSRDTRMVERAIVLQVLRDDHEERWSREELVGEISDFQPAVLDEALVRLERDGVVRREGEQIWASRASRRLDELELISI